MNKLITTGAAVLVAGGIVAGVAIGGGVPATMPAKEATGVSPGTSIQQAVPKGKLGGKANSYFYLSNGGGQVKVTAYATKGFDGSQTVTITPPSGSKIIQGFATISGGMLGSMVIKSTQSTPNAYKINLGYPGEQGTPGQLTFRVQLGS